MAARCDLVVYGASPAGIGAAIAAARSGLHVILLEPLGQIGGMLTGGLGRTDLGRPETVGGLFREFMGRTLRHYRERSGDHSRQVQQARGGERFEPSVARLMLEQMLHEAGLQARLGWTVGRARTERGELIEAEFACQGRAETLAASCFVDASYEGDLLAAAGAEYTVGREPREQYGEEHAGHLFWDPQSGRPTDEGTGAGDDRIQAYCFRLCLTDDPANHLVVERPEGYHRGRYELLEAYLKAKPRRLTDVLLPGELPNRKWDINNWGFCWQSMDFIEGNAGYVEADWEGRRHIAQAHRDYQHGLLYFLQNDPAVAAGLREEANRFGLCRDEFVDAGGWPEQLYVREARRLIGRQVFTEHDARRDRAKVDAIAVGSYPLDSHATQWYRVGQQSPAPEGFFMCSTKPYDIPYRCLLPKSPRRLLVPVCLSATHAGYGTLRMEPVMMNLGMVCGLAAALAQESAVTPDGIDVEVLQARLGELGQVVRTRSG